jgi:peptidoglycan-associated lipoprotein
MIRRISTPAELRWTAILLAALLAFSAGCASKTAPVEETEGTDSEFSDGADSRVPDTSAQDTRISAADVRIPPVYFDLDKSDIRSEYTEVLEAGSMALKESAATVVIEGHTDERGSEEYNFALGERRAGAVRKYLYNMGVPMSQMTVISYGEARPAVSGRGETAWQLNRRAEFKVR